VLAGAVDERVDRTAPVTHRKQRIRQRLSPAQAMKLAVAVERSLSEVVGRTTTDSEHTVAGAESSVPNFKKETP
jgi:hypothetical protein